MCTQRIICVQGSLINVNVNWYQLTKQHFNDMKILSRSTHHGTKDSREMFDKQLNRYVFSNGRGNHRLREAFLAFHISIHRPMPLFSRTYPVFNYGHTLSRSRVIEIENRRVEIILANTATRDYRIPLAGARITVI